MSEQFVSFTEALEEVVFVQPEKLALVSTEQSLTYAQLWEKSGQVAAFLGSTGLLPGERVGICLSKSIAWLTAVIGCWRAGMVMTPLDPCAPSERLEWQAKHASLALVLGQGQPPAGISGALWIDLALASDTEAQFQNQALQEGDPAYLIYTSGTTGQPKGVLVPHRGIVPVLKAQIEAFELTPESRFLWLLSPLFDASLSDLGSSLLAGACLYFEPGLERDLARLKLVMARDQITHTDLPPSLLPLLKFADFPASFQTMVLGGEPSAPEMLQSWARHFRLINVYGPTETTICASLCLIDPESWEFPLLGQPLPGFSFAVMDAQQREVSIGNEGELWIQGPGLALGYISNARLTRERFREREGQRYYASGDHVRLLPNHQYGFLGRYDRQIKWHGQRLEPEEIENCLLAHTEIARVAVFLHAHQGQDESVLSIAVQAIDPENFSLDSAQNWLKSRLPDWMQPVRWFELTDWPVTVTGKTDFEVLKHLSLTVEGPQASIETPEEALYLSIWREILNRPNLGVTDSLGAHSLQKLEFLARVNLSGIHLHPEQLNQCDSVRQCLQSTLTIETVSQSVELLHADTHLSPTWQTFLTNHQGRSARGRGEPLLTGATGFLGRWLLRGLLEDSKGPIHCLVRAQTVEEGLSRLFNALSTTGQVKKDWTRRIVPWCGNLEAEYWGLANSSWKRLALATDRIIHSAARVHLSEPYELLKAINLGGTQTAVQLQATGRKKTLNYISTLSVFVGSDRNQGLALESDDLSQTRQLYGGYAQSKWASEVWLRNVAAQAGPIQIFRLGLVCGDTQSGWFPEKDWFQWMTQGLVYLGCLPADLKQDWALDLTPVDFAAKAILGISKKPQTGLNTFHIANPEPLLLGNWIKAILNHGVHLEFLPRQEWLMRMQAALQSCTGPEKAASLLALCRVLGEEHYQALRALDLFQTTGIRFDTQAADAILHPAGITCPAPSPELLALYLSQMLGPKHSS
jgi:amino acid adenylation domain-containing protein/thioester reductase-like protein